MTGRRAKHVGFEIPIGRKGARLMVHGDPLMKPETKAALTRVCEAAYDKLVGTRQLGPVARELWRVKDCTLAELYHWNPRTRRYGVLSQEARRVISDAHTSVTGMTCSVNDYWLAEVMSEAIEAAEALKL